MRNLIIIGAGAAGLAAMAFALDKNLDVLLISGNVGGKASWQQHLADELAPATSLAEQTVRFLSQRVFSRDDDSICDTVTQIIRKEHTYEVVTAHHGSYETLGLLIATGVTPIRLHVPGAERLFGYGLGYSTITHAHLVRNKAVAAIGSTQRAVRGVHELSRLAEKVYWIVEDRQAFHSPLGVALQYRPNVEVIDNCKITQIDGAVHVQAVVIEQQQQTRRLVVSAAFVDLGIQPRSDFVRHLVRTDRQGFIMVDPTGACSEAGIFAAGDVTTDFAEQLLLALGQGARAALSAYDYILAHPLMRQHGA